MIDSSLPGARVTVAAILVRTLEMLRRSALRVVVALVVLIAPGVAIDAGYVSGDGEGALTLLHAFLSLFLQFWLTKALLEELGWHGPERIRFPAFFALSFASAIGIALGLLLLIVPGIILFVRWSIGPPILLGSDEGAIDSMRRSWHETEGHFWPILAALSAIYLPAVAFAGAAFLTPSLFPSALPGIVLINLVLQAGVIAGWHAAVAIYVLVGGPAALTRVFE